MKGEKFEDAYNGLPLFITFGKGLYQLRNRGGRVQERKVNICLKVFNKKEIDAKEKDQSKKENNENK